MTGAIINAAAIVLGGIVGLIHPKPLSVPTQGFCKMMLGALALLFGLRLTWMSIGGSFGTTAKQIFIAFVALVIGNLLGKLLHLQAGSNQLGHYAKKVIEANRPNAPHRFSNGMNVCTVLFCAAPLGILGAIQDGLPFETGDPGYFYPLVVKALMDGLATMGFVMMFGVGAIFSALPVVIFFGTITMATHIWLEPFLRAQDLLNSVQAVGGLIVCTVGVVIFEIRRVPLADYLPALAVAPLLTWIWK